MTRDFDARVRDLHEAPLDIGSVKGKAHQIKRNRRAAVAGGILGVAAVITPIAVILGGDGDTKTDRPPLVDDPSQTIADPAAAVDYIEGRTWHQADGDEVPLPRGDYSEAGIWEGQLVTLTPGLEVFPSMSIFDENGELVEKRDNTAGFAISTDGSILSFTTGDGELIARWDGGEERLATGVLDTAGGESYGGAPASVIGTAPCEAGSGSCLVRVNTYTDGCLGIGSSDAPFPLDARICFDEQDGLVSYSDQLKADNSSCGGVADVSDAQVLWRGCAHEPGQISPDGQHVVGKPSYQDGLGFKEISVLDAQTGEPAGVHTVEGDAAFIWSDVAWTPTNNLLFVSYDGADWRLNSMTPDGDVTELAEPVPGTDVDNPWVLIHH